MMTRAIYCLAVYWDGCVSQYTEASEETYQDTGRKGGGDETNPHGVCYASVGIETGCMVTLSFRIYKTDI